MCNAGRVGGGFALLFVVGVLLGGAERASAAGRGTAPARASDTTHETRDDEDCSTCHAGIAQELSGSIHGQAFADPVFQSVWRAEQDPTCLECHAPGFTGRAAPATDDPHAGVTCSACHQDGDRILGAGSGDSAPHDLWSEPQRVRQATCVGCHEFDLDSPAETHGHEQWTAREHAASPARDITCAECHMPRVGDGPTEHASHVFAASRSPEMLRRAVDITATREGDTAALVLSPAAIGHAFPTGEAHRRLLVVAEAEIDGRIQRRARALGRHFTLGPDGTLVQIGDDRVGPVRSIDVELALPGADEIRWSVHYQQTTAPALDGSVDVLDSTEIATGTLPSR